jgi:hypothetical protein
LDDYPVHAFNSLTRKSWIDRGFGDRHSIPGRVISQYHDLLIASGLIEHGANFVTHVGADL